MDMFEDAPDDEANWGAAISTEEKLYKTGSAKSKKSSSSSSSSSSDETAAEETEKAKGKKVRFSGKAKLRLNEKKSAEQGYKGRDVARPGTVRAQTARAAKNQ